MQKIQDIPLHGLRVIIRVDFNVPLINGEVSNSQRIVAALPTIEYALAQGAAVILLSHLGRPQEGQIDPNTSLAPVTAVLADKLNRHVTYCAHWRDGIAISSGEVVLCENVRFNRGEKANDDLLAQALAQLGDVFVMDAFASAHRAHASTVGIAQFSKTRCAGLLLQKEIAALQQAMQQPASPVVAVVGGAKVSTKLSVLSALLEKTDQLILGGGIANTFLAAEGFEVGKSLIEPDLIEQANAIAAKAAARGVSIPLPTDVVVATEFSATAQAEIKAVANIADDDMILDIGPKTRQMYHGLLQQAGTIIWNGPVGVFEFAPFAAGTKSLAEAIATSEAFSLAGGGDTIAAIDTFDVAAKISYISTGGGAFLEYIEGSLLPGVVVLNTPNT